jgi:benzil reductase ((S)-benzoin forming)
MQKHFYITGTTSGLGRSLTKRILSDPQNVVYGISRTQVNQHEHYRHFSLDLSERSFPFFPFETTGANAIVLINNAGWIGPILPLGEQDDDAIDTALGVNLVAPVILMNRFLKETRDFDGRKVIVNISSGAANKPIASWSTYCAAKAAIDMVSRVAQLEHPEVEVYSIAPGVVDTAMQAEIRSGNPAKFPDLSRFLEYHSNGDLVNPEVVADKIYQAVMGAQRPEEVVFSVRNL